MKLVKIHNSLSLRMSFLSGVIGAIMAFIIPFAATAREDTQSIQQVAHLKVEGCELVDDIQGFAGWGETAQEDKAIRQALREAADLQATHVVWTQLPKKYGSHYAYGKAYQCDSRIAQKD